MLHTTQTVISYITIILMCSGQPSSYYTIASLISPRCYHVWDWRRHYRYKLKSSKSFRSIIHSNIIILLINDHNSLLSWNGGGFVDIGKAINDLMIMKFYRERGLCNVISEKKYDPVKHIKWSPWISYYTFHISIPQGECTFQTGSN